MSERAVTDEMQDVSAELEQARRTAEEHLRDLQRVAADFSNYRKRVESERSELVRQASATLVARLLDVLDNFDRALEQVPRELVGQPWVEGIWLVERQIRSILEAEGLRTIEAQGKPFDPREHEALLHEERHDVPDGTVVEELQRGYKLHERVLRPALVKISKATTPITED